MKMLKIKSSKKIRNIIIGSFAITASLLMVAGSVQLFIAKEEISENRVEQLSQAYDQCSNAGRLRNFAIDESESSITFFSPNLQNTPYSTMSAMVATANACQSLILKEACIGPGCEGDRGVGIPFSFTLEQEG